jgi:hypothetical protein
MKTELIKRLSVEDIIKLRNDSYREMKKLQEQAKILEDTCKKLDGRMSSPYSLQKHFSADAVKILDYRYWRYMVQYFHLQDFMLSSEYEKLSNEVEHFRTPEFTYENVIGWVAGMKDLINNGVKTLAESVYNEIIKATYETGSRTKKRNNNGVDKRFIIRTGDYGYDYCCSREPTITDDLEKLCYILDGKELPEHRMKEKIYRDYRYLGETSCPYFSIKVCKNNNTHFLLTDETVARLNKIGNDGFSIGEDVKIKVF